MSFWDHIKPSPKTPAVTQAELSPDKKILLLTWDDGKRSSLSARVLRQNCPCAGCVDEWTRKRTLDPNQIPQNLEMESLDLIGNYALSFVFSDRHRTGIYTWPHLREIASPT